MPTFTANRSSSAILKTVLHEEVATVNVPSKASSATEESAQGNAASLPPTLGVQSDPSSTIENNQNI